ncbi:MAG TPA: AzlC family ABC transporter permease [Egibacteraceae bacterium]|nr:AzlC family ABC transporter permease [Egibacteraceae bacterium]
MRKALVIGVAVGIYGVSFGVLAVAAGVSVWQAVGLSALVFAGGSQFAAVGVIAAGGAPLTAVAGGLLLNSRMAAFGLALAPVLGGSVPTRMLAAHLLIDESSAMALAEDDPRAARRAFWLTGVSVFVCWNAATLFGALAGSLIGDPEAIGLDAAFPAGFLALLGPLLTDRAARASALAGALIALALLPFTPAGVPILAASAGVLGGLLARRAA